MHFYQICCKKQKTEKKNINERENLSILSVKVDQSFSTTWMKISKIRNY